MKTDVSRRLNRGDADPFSFGLAFEKIVRAGSGRIASFPVFCAGHGQETGSREDRVFSEFLRQFVGTFIYPGKSTGYVLEINAGAIDRLGAKIGDKVTVKIVY